MSDCFSIKSVWPRRWTKSDFIYNDLSAEECAIDYDANNEEQYEEIPRVRKQIINKHIQLTPSRVTKIDATDVKYLPDEFKQLVPKMIEATKTFLEKAKKLPARFQKAATRGKITKITWHFGRWERQGNPEDVAALMREECAKEYVAAMEEICEKVDELFKANFPELWLFMRKVLENDLPGDVSKVFRMFALNDSTSNWHTDSADFVDGYCAVIPFGDFEGGDLLLPDLNLKIAARSGDIIFFRSHQLLHKNSAVIKGHRQSIVFYTHQLAVSRYLMSVNEDLETTEDALAYCRKYWSYKTDAKYGGPVPKIAEFKRIAKK